MTLVFLKVCFSCICLMAYIFSESFGLGKRNIKPAIATAVPSNYIFNEFAVLEIIRVLLTA